MREKRPFQLKLLLVVYNLGLVGLSLYMFYEVIIFLSFFLSYFSVFCLVMDSGFASSDNLI